MPNYGIAPGTLFIIKGTGMSDQPLSALQSSKPPGLPTALNGVSISVTVDGTTVTPGIYYTSPTQIAAVLPSNTPIGMGTLFVRTNRGRSFPDASVIVVSSAVGLDTLDGSGHGSAVAEDAAFNLLTSSHPAHPGQTVILWGTGTGADASNDDRTFPMKQNNLTNIGMTVEVGGVPASIAYRGRSQYPGVDQIVLAIPTNVSPGCYVSVVVRSGANGQVLNSNFATIPVAADSGPCSDPISSSMQLAALRNLSAVKVGGVGITHVTPPASPAGVLGNSSFLEYTQEQFSQLLATDSVPVSSGSCIVNPPQPSSPSIDGVVGLDAGGAVTLNGPSASFVMPRTMFLGSYGPISLPKDFIPDSGGVVTVSNDSGGTNVGGFMTSLAVPPLLNWTNAGIISTVNRSDGVTVTWTGADASGYVVVTGDSYAFVPAPLQVSFTCMAPSSALSFAIPASVLLSLPALTASGTYTGHIELSTKATATFSARGLDIGLLTFSQLSGINVSFR